MDDLVFKVIPAEGFDPNTDSDRISNPTPTRKGKQPVLPQEQPAAAEQVQQEQVREIPQAPAPVLPLRLENADVSETAAAAARFSDLPGMTIGRASCPTPTRRDAAPQRPDTGQPVFQDPNARLSNPTPSRRRGALQPAAAAQPVQ
ncbi:MAG: hypothetical protein J6Z45_06520, partial [Oscillospiraceae bacterium]|nr:hypothetical protein [Oscillospiraceae bacterium]